MVLILYNITDHGINKSMIVLCVWKNFGVGAWDGLRYFIVALPEPSIITILI